MNAFYGTFLKTKQSPFNNKRFDHLFKIIKNKGYTKTFKMGEEGEEELFSSMNVNLFCDMELEQGKTYLIWVEESGEYLGNKYATKIGIQEIPETKLESLLKRYLKTHPQKAPVRELSKQVVEFSESEESDGEAMDEAVAQAVANLSKPKPKKKKRKTKKVKKPLVMSDSEE